MMTKKRNEIVGGKIVGGKPMRHHGERRPQKPNWFVRRVALYRKQGMSFKAAVKKAKEWGKTATFKQRYG